ncbi:NAD(P)-dependent oxidoreductase [Leuconostoc citreum]
MPKDWNGNNSTNVVTNGFANLSNHEREVNDYYATDPIAVKKLLEFGIPFTNVWENAVGGWHLADVLDENNLLSKASDIINRRPDYIEKNEKTIQTEVIDFLEYNNSESWNGDIITNPPYKYAKEWALKSIDAVTQGHYVALFLPIRYLEGKARRNELFDQFPPKFVFVSSSRIKAAMNGKFDEMKGSAVTYTWMIWQKGYNGPTILKWFN